MVSLFVCCFACIFQFCQKLIQTFYSHWMNDKWSVMRNRCWHFDKRWFGKFTNVKHSLKFSTRIFWNILVTFQIDYLVVYILVPNHDSSFAEKLRFFFFFFSISRHFLSIFFLLQTEDKLLTLYNRWKAEVKRKCHIIKVWSITTLTNLQVKLMEFCWKKKVFVILAQNLLRIVRSFVIVLNIEFRIYQ